MEWESGSPCCSRTYPEQERWAPGRCSGSELEFRDCGAIPGRGLLLTAERRTEGVWGRRLWWEMPVEESQAAMEGRQYCWVIHWGWSHHHSLSFSARQHRQLDNRETGPSNAWVLNCRVGPHPGCSFKWLMPELQSRTPARGAPLYMPDVPNNRQGAQAREPSKSLKGWSYRERLAKEAFWTPATRGSKKDSDRAATPEVEEVCVPAHLALPGSPRAKHLRHLHAELSLGQSCHRQRSLASMHTGSLRSCLTLQPCRLWPARLLCQGGGFSRQEHWSIRANTGWKYPSRALYFLLL